jgi:citrate lyase beta subunit
MTVADGSGSRRVLALARSALFVPAGDDRKWARALRSAADIVILDLEDAIAPAEKDRARASIAPALQHARRHAHEAATSPVVLVRVNGLRTRWADADLAAAAGAGADGIVVPKSDVAALVGLPAGGAPVVAIIETAAGLRSVHEVAEHPRVLALLLGGADLAAELGLEYRPDGQEILFARSQLVLASAAAGLRPPIDVVHLDVRAGESLHGSESLRAEALLARSLGMGAKACIHPAQVPTVNDVFSPSEREIESAHETATAYATAVADGSGVTMVNGKMIDAPLALRAERILSRASALMAHRQPRS